MAKLIVDLYLDGYDTDEQREDACAEFIYSQLTFTASSVEITPLPDAHELWVAAQLMPGEGIEDGVKRIEELLGGKNE